MWSPNCRFSKSAQHVFCIYIYIYMLFFMFLLGTVQSIPLYFSATFLIFLHDTCDFVDSRYTDNPHIRIFHGWTTAIAWSPHSGTGLMGPLLKDLGVQHLEGVDLSSKMLQVRLHCLGILDLHRRTALSMGFSHQVFRGYLSELFISAIGVFPFPMKTWFYNMLYFSRLTNHPPQKEKKRYFHS